MQRTAKRRLKLVIIFGGQSAEHTVSISSARNIALALDPNKYEVSFIGITRHGKWLLADRPIDLEPENQLKTLTPTSLLTPERVDIVFPVLHGPNGEDGTIQGLLKLLRIPFVGAGVLGSAIGMDKDVMKRLLQQAGIPIGKFLVFSSKESIDNKEIREHLGFPCFIKPANLGSSVGITKAHKESELNQGVELAFSFDRKIIIEQMIEGREIECSVLGNKSPIASLPGEIIAHHEFYDYEAKYQDKNAASLVIPAKLTQEQTKKVQGVAIKAFTTLCAEGMARVDMFLTPRGEILVNEINTIPGFTNSSMYPKLWEASGLSYSELIDKLIELAIERFQEEQTLETVRVPQATPA